MAKSIKFTAATEFAAVAPALKNNGTQSVANWKVAAENFADLFNALQEQKVNPFAVYRQAKEGTLWLNGHAPKSEVMISKSKSGGFNVKLKVLQKAGGQTVPFEQKFATMEDIAKSEEVLAWLIAPVKDEPAEGKKEEQPSTTEA